MAGELTWGISRWYLGAESLWKMGTDSTRREVVRPPAGSSSARRDTLEKRRVGGL